LIKNSSGDTVSVP
jgi:hypothetical protein